MLLEKFGHICNVNRLEAEQQNFIKTYGNFPINSDFNNPFPNRELTWAVIMKIGGQKGRVAGHIIGYTFYVVFLPYIGLLMNVRVYLLMKNLLVKYF